METFGALVDRLSIVNLKLWHCQELLFNELEQSTDDRAATEKKNTSLLGQRADLIDELDAWMAKAVDDPASVALLNPQNKMYGRFRKDG
jgi:hypothetical protein